MNQNRKTIAPQDVFKALEDLEFPEFRPRLEMELTRSCLVFSGVREWC
jgi:DNA polymerase epsilon subunit 3